MRKTIASLLTALMVLSLGAGTVTATGNSKTSLNRCTNATEDYFGGVKVYARDGAKGPSRVLCPPAETGFFCGPPDCDQGLASDGGLYLRFDKNLNGRNRNLPPLEDIWNGFRENIESVKLRAAPGCITDLLLVVPDKFGISISLFHRHLDNRDGSAPKTRFYEVGPRKDNKAIKVDISVDCLRDEAHA